MKAMILGAGGQVGRALCATAPSDAQIVAMDRAGLDIGDPSTLSQAVAAERPDIIFNAAAYTAVDKAESEPETAYRVNADAPGWLAKAAAKAHVYLAHLSTDFVFDGASSQPYAPNAPAHPLNVYGQSKWKGEENVREALPGALIVRTSWVYASSGRNFVRTILGRLVDGGPVRVVADQIGTPTFATGLAQALWKLAGQRTAGTYHYTDSGVASWYDFAVAIEEEARALGFLRSAVPVTAISTTDYPTPARRPAFSVLDKTATWAILGTPAPHWRTQLRAMLSEVKTRG